MLIGYKIAKKIALFKISKSGYLNFELIQGATLKIPEVIFLLFQILDNVGFVELLIRQIYLVIITMFKILIDYP